MGVKQFFQLFDGTEIKLNDLAGSKIAVDVMVEIYRSSIVQLTDSQGNSTAHIMVLFNSILGFIKNNITPIYIFDSPTPNVHKTAELECREKKRQDAKAKGKPIFQVTKQIISDVQKLLTYLGVAYATAPDGYDAEHVCAEMNKVGMVKHILTTDADAFMFGGLSVLKYEKRKLINYTIENIMETTNLSYDQLLRLGACLGTDYCSKSKGVGLKTVVKKCLLCEMSDDQNTAISIFKSTAPIPKLIEKNRDLASLVNWLVEKSFNEEKIQHLIKDI